MNYREQRDFAWGVRIAAVLVIGLAGTALAAAPAGKTALPTLPTIEGAPAVASVNGSAISLKAVERQLALMHMGEESGATAGRQDPSALLDRMITAKLIAEEARESGLLELPEVKEALAGAERLALRDQLVAYATKDVKASPADVDRLYKQYTRRYTLLSILIPKEADAKEFETKLKGGTDFATLAKSFREAGKGTGNSAPNDYRLDELSPSVQKLMTLLKPGQSGPRQTSQKGESAFVHLVGIKYPEDPAARARAQSEGEDLARKAALKKYLAGVRRKQAVVDTKLLASLDYSKPEAAKKLAEDKRTVATIAGGSPITVAELTAGMQRRFFHGVDKAAEKRDVNAEKEPVLDDLIDRQVAIAEARRLKLDQTTGYRQAMAQREEQILFTAYVEKAIVPGIKVSEADVKNYFESHKKEFASPEMLRLESLAFVKRADAEDALAKLQRGADLKWLTANAAGQVPKAERAKLEMPSGVLMLPGLPEALQKQLKGAKKGDFRFYGPDPAGPFFVVAVLDQTASQQPTLEAVKTQIEEKLRAEKLAKAMEDTSAQLRKVSDVKVFATGKELNALIMKDLGVSK